MAATLYAVLEWRDGHRSELKPFRWPRVSVAVWTDEGCERAEFRRSHREGNTIVLRQYAGPDRPVDRSRHA